MIVIVVNNVVNVVNIVINNVVNTVINNDQSLLSKSSATFKTTLLPVVQC